jgi:hypothetical protein
MEAHYVLCEVRTEYSYINIINPPKVSTGEFDLRPLGTNSIDTHFVGTLLYITAIDGCFKPRFD